MVNTNPRRNMPKRSIPKGDRPWTKGDPTRKVGLNTPLPEPLMLMLDYLIENKVIFSKASFIRDVVEKAAEVEIGRLWKVREAVKRLDAEGRRK
jgi:hypothetical protein